MFTRRHQNESFSKHHNASFDKHSRAGKATSSSKQKRSFRDHTTVKKGEKTRKPDISPPQGSTLTSPIITISVGPDNRLFAAHESILSSSPFFAAIIRSQFLESHTKRCSLPDESPEIFSSVLEYLYKGDYYPRLLHNKRKNCWELEDNTSPPTPSSGGGRRGTNGGAGGGGGEAGAGATVFDPVSGQSLLKDTLLYCTAEKFTLPELKRLALRKQGLHSGIPCSTILASARYAYANTPDSDSKLRAHYLALIIRSRATFKRSGTMQLEMERGGGGGLWFDLFVAICNHMDDMASSASKSPFSKSPRNLF